MNAFARLFTLLLFILGCQLSEGQTVYTEIYPKHKIEIKHEKINIDIYQNRYNNKGILDYNYTERDGTRIRVSSHKKNSNIEIYENPTLPYIYTLYKEFYPDGNLKQMGAYLPLQLKIGKWLECNKNGVCKTTDYEIERDFYGYNDILEFLEKEGYLKKGNGNLWTYKFWFSSETKNWGVKLSKGNTYHKKLTFDSHKKELIKEEDFTLKVGL